MSVIDQLHMQTPEERLAWIELRSWAEIYDSATNLVTATNNRVRAGNTDRDQYDTYLISLEVAKEEARKGMVRAYRATVPAPIRVYVKATNGLGEPLMARLLGSLGHPRIANPLHWEGTGSKRVLVQDPPYERTLDQLWQYCGHGRPGRLKRGMTADELMALGKPDLKMLVHLNAVSLLNAGIRVNDGVEKGTPFAVSDRHAITKHGQIYLDLRSEYETKVHSVECVRCGPSGKPAQPGSPWSPGHQHAAALRRIGKDLLRDLWQVSA